MREQLAQISLWGKVFVLLHIGKVLYFFRGVDVSTPAPLVNLDYAMYYGRIQRFIEFLDTHGRFWGYDPFEMAGYVSGPIDCVGLIFFTLVCYGLSAWIPVWQSLLALEFLGILILPFILFAAVLIWTQDKRHAYIAFMLHVALANIFESFSLETLATGTFGYRCSLYVGFLQVALFKRWLDEGLRRIWVVMTLMAILIPMLSPMGMVVVMIPNISLFVYALSHEDRFPNILFMLATACLVLVMNWFWVKPLLSFYHWKLAFPYFNSIGTEGLIRLFNPFQSNLYSVVRGALNLILMGLSISYLSLLWKEQNARAFFFLSWLLFLGTLAVWGSHIPFFQELQPGRFLFPFWLLVWILAAGFLVKMRQRVLIFLLGLPLVIFGMGASSHASVVAWPWLTNQFPPSQKKVMQYLKDHPLTEGRTFLECAEVGMPHFSNLVPLSANRVMLGGPTPGHIMPSRFTIFTTNPAQRNQPIVFGQFLKDISAPHFLLYLDLYNIHQIITHTALSDEQLRRFEPYLTLTQSAGRFKIYEVKEKSSWFVEGSGTLQIKYDQLIVAAPSPGKMILKFHWIHTLRNNLGIPMEPVRLYDDPVPFISLHVPPATKELIIFNQDDI